ncbi:MAG: patatin-like phospholipase family protein [Chitinophagaceae bacterium]|nr:MAG: patatin-like phospholipase family protein [Chitinophagaceae bacterium]
MKPILRGLYYSFPIQLVLLHLKKFQVLLIFWYLLFSTVGGSFMKSYGADSLFLAPEYLGSVDFISAAMVGISIGIFIMSWNITTFILFSRHFQFLATTTKPFLKYCINNGVIPLAFLVYYLIEAIIFDTRKELMSVSEVLYLCSGFLTGLALIIIISLFYFFRADISIIRRLTPLISNPKLLKAQFNKRQKKLHASRIIRIEWYLNSLRRVKKVRDVSHYSTEFIESVFSRHHFAAVLSIFIAFVFLIIVGFCSDARFFQLPAAAGITVFFAILIAVSGAFSYFLQSWSLPFLILLFAVFNLLYKYDVIDPTNKAYGLNYNNRADRPVYDRDQLMQMMSDETVESDKANMIAILDRWKAKQRSSKPVMFIINTSGGGNRSANFTMNVLQRLDSLSNGKLMDQTFLITGASGGMLGAAYFRELYKHKLAGAGINIRDSRYVNNISQDLLNSIFTSFVARDLASPAQKFEVGDYQYIKDRGYAFEQKLNENTGGLLDKQLGDLAADEASARVPLMFFNSVITRDGRKLIISTQPVSFLMKPVYDTLHMQGVEADAVDYQALFRKQNPMNLRLLTALRMNATFPYILPNVWLPTKPVVDVMDAGLRDNYGQESAIRFVHVFRKWIADNTSGIVLLQIKDRKSGGWDEPYESHDISEIVTKPLLLLQFNWFKMQEFNQDDVLGLTQAIPGINLHKISFQYVPKKEDGRAALSFHLTKREQINIAEALSSENNQDAFARYLGVLGLGQTAGSLISARIDPAKGEADSVHPVSP